MQYELSEDDMRALLPGVRVVSYPELSSFSRIEDAMDQIGRVVILFLTTGLSQGHWITVHANPNTHVMEFFDSYGLRPDGERKWLSHSKLVELHEKDATLTHMLDDANNRGWKVVYNPYHFQREDDDSETCGRHVAVRLLHGGIDIKRYKALVSASRLTPDEFVLQQTRSVLGK